MRILLLLALFLTTFFSDAQIRCGTDQYVELLVGTDTNYAKHRLQVEKETRTWILNNKDYKQKSVITIPVVVHVVWNTNAENISDAQVISQIDILNADYRRRNLDTINTPVVWKNIAADCGIEFCLADIDPNGLTTNGINRVQTNENSFGMMGDPVKSSSSGGADPWPNEHYLNIWVCDLGNGLLGYATPPSGWISSNDGVVIGYKYFGNMGTVQPPYNKGRTATHEVGHWLNLEHTWGSGWQPCGDDNVYDTPEQEEENYGCPGFPHNANACVVNADGDMFMNYMDYTNDGCMNLFTNGQKTRMVSAITQYRSNMLTHSLCLSNPNLIIESNNKRLRLIKIVDLLGREVNMLNSFNRPVFYIYNNGFVEKKMILE